MGKESRSRVLRVVVAGGFLKSYIEGLLAAVVGLLIVSPAVGDLGVSLFLGVGSAAHIVFTLMSGFLVRKTGVRRLMIASAVLPAVAVVFYVLPTFGVVSLIAGNAIKGVSFGILTAVSPLLIVEGAEVRCRGRGSALFQLSMQIGLVAGALIGAGVAGLFGHRPAWAIDIDFLLMLLPASVYLAAVLRLPDFTRGDAGRCYPQKAHGKDLRAILPAVGFMVLMSASGIGAVMNYSVVLLADAGFMGASANLVDALLRMFSIVAVVGAVGLVDRIGRVSLLQTGVCLMVLGFAGAALTSGWAFAASLLLAVSAFSGGFGVCAWVVVPELLPTNVRAQGTSLALVAGQITTCVMITFFPQVRTCCGGASVFWLFAAVSAVSFFYFGIIRQKS